LAVYLLFNSNRLLFFAFNKETPKAYFDDPKKTMSGNGRIHLESMHICDHTCHSKVLGIHLKTLNSKGFHDFLHSTQHDIGITSLSSQTSYKR